MKNKLLFYGIGLCIGLYIAAAMFPSRLADINVAIPDGYIISIFGSKLYNVPMYLSIMMDLVSDTDLDKATKIFFLKSIAPCIVTIILLAVVMFWEYINPKPNTHGTAEWADTNYLEQLFLFKDSPTSPVIGVSEPVWLTPIYKWLCNFEEYRAIGQKPPKEKIERLHKFVALMRQLGIRRLLRGKTDTHYVGIAPTGAGKGIAWIIATLLGAWRESCLVTDLKGELWDLTSKYRKEKLGQLVMKFNPTALDHRNVRWNPISEIRWGTEHEMKDVSNLAEVLVPRGKGEPFWVNSAKRLLSAVIIYLKYHDMKHPRPVETEGDSQYHETNLKDVLTFFAGVVVEDPNNISESEKKRIKSFQESLSHIIEHEKMLPISIPIKNSGGTYEMHHIGTDEIDFISPRVSANSIYPNIHPTVLTTFLEYKDMAYNTFSGIVTSITTPLAPYAEPILAHNTSTCDFHVTDLIRSDKAATLYIVLPLEDQTRVAPLFNLLVDMMMKKATADGNNANKHKILLLLDECANFGRIESLQTMITAVRSYGIQLMMIFQGRSDIERVYGKDNSILNNCSYHMYLKPQEITDLKFLSERIGKTTVQNIQDTKRGLSFFTDSRTSINIGRDLVTPTEVGLLNQQITFINGKKPIKTPYHLYFYDPMFLEREGSADTSSKIPDPFTLCIQQYMEEYGDILIEEAKPELISIHTLLNDEALDKVKGYALMLREEGEPMNKDGAALVYTVYGISKVDVSTFASLLLPLIEQWYSEEDSDNSEEDETSDSESDVTDHSDMLESLILDNPNFLEAEFNDPTSDMEYMDLGR